MEDRQWIQTLAAVPSVPEVLAPSERTWEGPTVAASQPPTWQSRPEWGQLLLKEQPVLTPLNWRKLNYHFTEILLFLSFIHRHSPCLILSLLFNLTLTEINLCITSSNNFSLIKIKNSTWFRFGCGFSIPDLVHFVFVVSMVRIA